MYAVPDHYTGCAAYPNVTYALSTSLPSQYQVPSVVFDSGMRLSGSNVRPRPPICLPIDDLEIAIELVGKNKLHGSLHVTCLFPTSSSSFTNRLWCGVSFVLRNKYYVQHRLHFLIHSRE